MILSMTKRHLPGPAVYSNTVLSEELGDNVHLSGKDKREGVLGQGRSAGDG